MRSPHWSVALLGRPGEEFQAWQLTGFRQTGSVLSIALFGSLVAGM